MATEETPLVSACVLARDGEVIVTVWRDRTTIQVRNPHTEGNATVALGHDQAGTVGDLLGRSPAPDDDMDLA